MRSSIAKRAESGFTLIEVLVALAVAGGSLALVLSANAASLGRGIRARSDARLERAVDSKLAETRIGSETTLEGPLPGFDGHRWRLRIEPERGTLKHLSRRVLTLQDAEGRPLLERSELVHGAR
jgi:prepilin-type N-terminal cleavage/methylation domain-containing protein